jgi:hypothetical protein
MYSQEMNPLARAGWAQFLGGERDDDVWAAVHGHVADSPRFPRVSEIRVRVNARKRDRYLREQGRQLPAGGDPPPPWFHEFAQRLRAKSRTAEPVPIGEVIRPQPKVSTEEERRQAEERRRELRRQVLESAEEWAEEFREFLGGPFVHHWTGWEGR